MTTRFEFESLPAFDRDLKKLSKKCASLTQDLDNFRKFIVGVDFDHNNRYDILHRDTARQLLIIKTRLMVRSLKGSSKMRLVFAFGVIAAKIVFIEIYMHGQQECESQQRIDDFLKTLATGVYPR